jgi:hypothetical protein
MSEELNLPAGDAPEQTQVETPQHTETELKAMEMGWRPKDEFSGNDDEFIDAKEFVRRAPLFDKIEQQGRQLKNTIKALESFKQHYTKVKEVEYERALTTLKAQRKEAMVEGDPDRFEQLDEQIKGVEKEADQIRAAHDTPLVREEAPVAPEWKNFQARNKWYDTVGYMREYADEVGKDLHKRGMSPAEVLKAVEAAVRKEFPQKFTNPNKASAPDVEGSSTPAKRGSTEKFELNDVERQIMNNLVRAKVLTKEEYINDLKKAKGVA